MVTLEPFPVANANLPHVDLPVPDIPTTVVGAQDIERLVTLTDITPSSLLLEQAADLQPPGHSTNASMATRAPATRSSNRDGRPTPGRQPGCLKPEVCCSSYGAGSCMG